MATAAPVAKTNTPAVAVPTYGTTQYNPQTGAAVGVNKFDPNTGLSSAPKVSTTTISNSNKIDQVSKNVGDLNNYSQKGVQTDAAGTPRYADGSFVPEQTTEADTSDEDSSINTLLDNMKASTDATAANQISNIQAQFGIRKQQQQDSNMRQEKKVQNALLMGGATGQGSSAQYAPISSEGIISAQESYGVQQLAQLDTQENSLIAEAKAAQDAGNYKVMEDKLALVKEKRAKKVAQATKLNDAIMKRNEESRTKAIQASRDSAVSDLYAQGITDVPTMLEYLNNNGQGDFTAKEVQDIIKDITPTGLDDLVKTLRINGAPGDVIAKVLSSKDINQAYEAAGAYGSGGTGIIGEYNFYKAQAEAKGQVPVDFNTYQNMDANRKAKAAGVGSGGTGNSGKYSSDLDALVGNAVNTISSKFGQETFKDSISKARNDADKLNTIATVVLKNSPGPIREDFVNQTVGIKQIDKALNVLNDGLKSGLINNAAQYLFNKTGNDFDPKLAAINAYITSAIQPYRNSVTGAAWGSQEESEYDQLFGSTKYSPKELKDRLTRVKEIMKDKTINALNAQVNPLGSDNPFDTTGDSLVETEDKAKTMVDDFYKNTTPDLKVSVKSLIGKGFTNAQVVEYLRTKGVI